MMGWKIALTVLFAFLVAARAYLSYRSRHDAKGRRLALSTVQLFAVALVLEVAIWFGPGKLLDWCFVLAILLIIFVSFVPTPKMHPPSG